MCDPLLLSGWPLLIMSSTGRLFAAAHRVMTDDVRPKDAVILHVDLHAAQLLESTIVPYTCYFR